MDMARGSVAQDLTQVKEALERKTRELAASLSRLRATMESTTDAIVVASLDGTVTDFNLKYLELWRIPRELVAAGNHLQVVQALSLSFADPARFIARIREIYETSPEQTYDLLELADGRVFERVTKLQSVDGKSIGRVWSFHDITVYEQAARELAKSENLKAAILKASLDAIITTDHTGKVISFNPAAEKIFGYSESQAVGKFLARLIFPDPETGKGAAVVPGSDAPTIGRRVEVPAVHADGHEMTVELSLARIPGSQPPMFTWTMRDVTGVKSVMEIKLQLASIVESSHDAIIGKTLDGIITTWTRGAERIFGYTPEEIIGKPITTLIPDDRLEEEVYILDRLRHGLGVDQFESKRKTKSGRIIDVSFSSSPIVDANGTVIGASKILHDITARKEAEEILKRTEATLHAEAAKAALEREQLLESERSARATAERMGAVKDEFLATLSHELRTPLSAILGWAHLLKRGPKNEADLTKGLEVIERNARMQAQLIEDLLDMSRITSGKVRLDIQPVQPLSFIEAAIETVRPAAEAKGIRLERMLDPSAGPISGDPSRLQQVVWNLLSNAIKFTPRDGKVQITLQRVNSHIEISVADTGMGIRPEFLEHVFERFRQADATTTRKFGGLGLGLSIVKHLTELHGGTVRVLSDGDGHGATFIVHLPLAVVHRNVYSDARQHPEHPISTPRDFESLDLSGIKVLVVDDEADARDLVKRVLTECNANVLTAGSAQEALRLIEAEKPDVLVSDIGMPDMDGFELLKKIRGLGGERGGRVPAIALTAFARSEDRTRALHAGFLVHISKPVEPSELAATVASVAGRTGGASGAQSR